MNILGVARFVNYNYNYDGNKGASAIVSKNGNNLLADGMAN